MLARLGRRKTRFFHRVASHHTYKLATEPDKYELATVGGEGQQLLCLYERVALYLLRPDAGLVVPAQTPTPTWLGDAQRAGLAS